MNCQVPLFHFFHSSMEGHQTVRHDATILHNVYKVNYAFSSFKRDISGLRMIRFEELYDQTDTAFFFQSALLLSGDEL